jgi:transcriptional antiterminator RfaH
MMKIIPGWYVIYTRPKHEKKVALKLEERKLTYLLPQTKVLRTWHDRKKIIEVPLFPSYLFISLDKIEDYYDGLECEGVLSFVKFGKEVARVKEETVDSLRLLMNDGKNIEVSEEKFNPGQKFMIRQGAFTGLMCELIEHKNAKRVLVRINLLNRSVLADLTFDLLAPYDVSKTYASV